MRTLTYFMNQEKTKLERRFIQKGTGADAFPVDEKLDKFRWIKDPVFIHLNYILVVVEYFPMTDASGCENVTDLIFDMTSLGPFRLQGRRWENTFASFDCGNEPVGLFDYENISMNNATNNQNKS